MLLAIVGRAEIKPFTFVHFSDSHIGSDGSDERLAQALGDVDKNFPEAAFIIITGDVTEFGRDYEFTTLTQVLKTSKRPVYPGVGNHDVRWSESGKENYRNAFGETYVRVDHNGFHVILMDVSMLIEHYGHFDGQQLAKLKADLEAIGPDEPVALAMHHPPLSAGKFIDNEFQFAELIGQYNVPLVCTGHGHAFQRYHFGGTAYCMGGSVSNHGAPPRSYRVYKVETDRIIPITRIYDRNKTQTEAEIPLPRAKPGELKVEQPVGVSGVWNVSLDGAPVTKTASITIDQITSHSVELGQGILTIPAHTLAPGIHQLTVAAPNDSGTTSVATATFETLLPGSAAITRKFPLNSGCQCHPTVDGDVLYVGANDGILRAIDLASSDGKVLWQKNLNREILSAPAVTTHTVVVGSMDTHVYCVDKKSGEEAWKFKTGQAVLASPLVAGDTVYIGSGDFHMYALDLKTGTEKWRFKAQRLIKATPALANGKLFFGAWDNFFYCLDAATGQLVWKVPVSNKANGHFSAATSNPIAVNDRIVFCSHDYSVRCLAQETGGTIWVYKPTKEELGPSYSTAVIHDGAAYFGSINGHVVGHDLETGAKVFDVNVRPEKKDDLFDSIPLLKEKRLYLGSVGGNLYCVDIPRKEVAWKVALQPGFIFTRPAAWRDRILVGSLADAVFDIQDPLSRGNQP